MRCSPATTSRSRSVSGVRWVASAARADRSSPACSPTRSRGGRSSASTWCSWRSRCRCSSGWCHRFLPIARAPVPVVTLGFLMLGIAFVVGGIQHAASGGWAAAGTLVSIVIGSAFLFVVARRRRPEDPLVPATVTRSAPFRLGTATATLSNWGSGVVMVLVPTAFELVRETTVLETGILFLAFSIPFALGGAASGLMIRRRDRALDVGGGLRGHGDRHGGAGDRGARRAARFGAADPRGDRLREWHRLQRRDVVRARRRSRPTTPARPRPCSAPHACWAWRSRSPSRPR